MSIIGLLVALVLIGLVWWAVVKLIAAFGITDPLATVIKVIFVVLVVLWAVSAIFGYGPGLRFR